MYGQASLLELYKTKRFDVCCSTGEKCLLFYHGECRECAADNLCFRPRTWLLGQRPTFVSPASRSPSVVSHVPGMPAVYNIAASKSKVHPTS